MTRTREVLIVEDDPEIRYLLSQVLARDDRRIFAVRTGAEAEEVLAEEDIDIVVLDLILPDLDGRHLLARMRGRLESAGVPIMVVTGRGGADIRQECYALGADGFTEKPFDPEVVAADVGALLEQTAGRSRSTLTDPVTGLLNRAGLVAELAVAEGDSTLALVQLEGFVTVSERWGWDVGEQVLADVGSAIRSVAGEEVRLARLGGGEFVLWHPDPSGEAVKRVADRVLDAVREFPIVDPEGEAFRLTAAIGVVRVALRMTLEEALDEARRRLFRAREAGRNQVVSEDDASDASERKVLVAEDDRISATILLHRLDKEGLDVTHCDNGLDAYEQALELIPDLVILDVKMPGMDGFEVLERLRRTPSFTAVPVIMLTSMGSEADVVRGFQLGADDYVLKPFSPIELSARVWRLLRRGRSATAL